MSGPIFCLSSFMTPYKEGLFWSIIPDVHIVKNMTIISLKNLSSFENYLGNSQNRSPWDACFAPLRRLAFVCLCSLLCDSIFSFLIIEGFSVPGDKPVECAGLDSPHWSNSLYTSKWCAIGKSLSPSCWL